MQATLGEDCAMDPSAFCWIARSGSPATPARSDAAALGAGGAIMLAAYRKLRDQDRSPRVILFSTLAIVLAILIGINFDLRINQEGVSFGMNSMRATVEREAIMHDRGK